MEFSMELWNWGWWNSMENSMEFRQLTEFDGIRFWQGLYAKVSDTFWSVLLWQKQLKSIKNVFLSILLTYKANTDLD
jgi:hypothetical protein